MGSDPSGRRAAIEGTLLEYHRSPGKHALILRQPAVLFSSIKEVLQLASGRSPEGNGVSAPPSPVRRAACFFIRAAMLYPDADHYALLGVDRAVDTAAVKDRYRLMMRLMHPDFANALSGADWPVDAATRVNRAYEVLSSPGQRRAYDEQLAASMPARPSYPAQHAKTTRVPAMVKVQAEDPRRRLKRLASAFGVAGGIAVIAAWFAAGQPDKETLVQRSKPPPSETIIAALPAPAAPPETPAAPAPPPLVAPEPPAPPPPPPAPQAPVAALRPALPAPAPMVAPSPVVVRAPVVAAPIAVPPAPVTQALAPAPVPVAAVGAAIAAPAPPPAPRIVAAPTPASGSPTMAEVHPLLTHLLQQLESGWGDRVLGLLDRESRATPGAQALLEKYNNLVDGMRPIRLSNAQFKTAEAREGRLLVTGRMTVQVRDTSVPPRELEIQAEFAARDGTVVLTRLAPARE
jgi:hypothetical protein